MKTFVAITVVAFIGFVLVEGHYLAARDTKSDLITKGNALLKKAEEAISHLRAGTHHFEVSIVKHEEERIKQLITDLGSITDETKITQLEHELSRAEHRLEHELNLIQHQIPTLPHIPRIPILPQQN